jgi:hypothetical protein
MDNQSFIFSEYISTSIIALAADAHALGDNLHDRRKMNLEISEIPRISITNRIKTGERIQSYVELNKNTVLRRYLLSRKA